MYLSYYGFDDYPFSVTPDPAFLYLSASHREALGHLLYGVGEHGGFVALIGEVGTGKTTLIRALVENDMPELDIALCWNPHLEVREFVATICDELGAPYDSRTDHSLKALVDRLNAHLLKTHAANRRTVLIIDEAQNLSRGVLEQLRLLTNLETHKHKLLRIILVGQPELHDVLARHDLRQLAQRITARCTLMPLSLAETRAYVRHRLGRAGGSEHLFTAAAIARLRLHTGGIPRLINMVCERALLGGYAYARSRVGVIMVGRAAAETLPRRRRSPWLRLAAPVMALLLVALAGALAWSPDVRFARAAQWFQTSIAGEPAAPEDASEQGGDSGDANATSVAAKDDDKRTAAAGDDASPADSADETGAEKTETAGNEASDEASTVAAPQAPAPPGGIPEGDADINQLLRLWGVFGSQVQTGCQALRVGDLRCLADRGSFAVVERYNRPALLTIQRDGRRQQVLLNALDNDNATLVGSEGTRLIPRAELARLWTGHFEVVWRSDAGISLIQPGAVGNAVVWLRRRLARAEGRNPDTELGPPSPIYDDDLEARLKRFQVVHGLDPDGMAGPRTQMMLNGAVSMPGSPELRAVEG